MLEAILKNDGIYELNEFTQVLNNIKDIEKLNAVLEYTNVSDTRLVTRIVENLDKFGYAKDIGDYEDLGRWWIDNNDNLDLSLELEDYFNFYQFGEDICQAYSGIFINDENNSYVYIKDGYLLEEILKQEEDLSMCGM